MQIKIIAYESASDFMPLLATVQWRGVEREISYMSIKEIQTPVAVVRKGCASIKRELDTIVRDVAMTICVNGDELATVVCSPWALRELAVGFLYSEGILTDIRNLDNLSIDEKKSFIHIHIKNYDKNPPGKVFMRRHVGSCCGRGRAPFYYYSADSLLCSENQSGMTVLPEQVFALSDMLEEASLLFSVTRGVHDAALADETGILIFEEDVGRRNAVDKIMGKCLLSGIDSRNKIIVFSGRVSSEILLKVSKMGCPVLISRSSVTELSISLAQELGITIIGFAKGGKFNIYTHMNRVLVEEDA